MSTASRVHFFERQFLRAQDLSDEQAYHLAAHRRHNISHHTWGIVEGLSLTQESGNVLVQPGVAIDGYGRELILESPAPLDLDTFDRLDASTLDVWLYYQRSDGAEAPAGYVSACERSENTFYRWSEVPCIELKRGEGPMLDPRRPPRVSEDALKFALHAPPPDDPREVWPVYLGTLVRDRSQPAEKQIDIDMSQRPYAGTVAAFVDHPQLAARIEIGSQAPQSAKREVNGKEVVFAADPERRFAVFIPEDRTDPQALNETGEVEPRLEVSGDGTLRVRGSAIVQGDVSLAGGALEFTAGQQANPGLNPEQPAIYRVQDASGDRLRIDLGAQNVNLRELVIGFTQPDGTFKECLKVEVANRVNGNAPARVTVFGDLVVEGKLEAERPRVVLSDDALRAIQAGFMTGVAAAMA